MMIMATTFAFLFNRPNKKSLSVDIEDSENVEHLQIQGFDAILVEKDGTYNIVYADTDHNTFVQVYCAGLERETALNLISEITFI